MSRWWVLPVLLAAAVLRLYHLGYQGLWFDESVSAYIARLDWWEQAGYVARWDAHSPLFYWWLSAWLPVSGYDEFLLRFPSAGFGILTVALVYRLGRQLGGLPLGVAGAAVAAANPALIYHAQQARMYAPVAMLLVLATSLLLDAWRRPTVRRYWVGYGASVLVSLYLLYWTGFVILFHLLFLAAALAPFLVPARRLPAPGDGNLGMPARLTFARRFILTLVLVGLAFVPWLPAVVAQSGLTGPGAWREFVPPEQMALLSLSALIVGEAANAFDTPWLWLPVAAGALLALASLAPAPGSPTLRLLGLRLARPPLFGWGHLLVPLVLIGGLSLVRPLFAGRYLVVFYPPLALLIAWGLLRLWRRSAVVAVLLLVALGGGQVYSLARLFDPDPQWIYGDYRSAALQLDRGSRPGDTIIFTSGATYPVLFPYLTRPVAWRGPLQDYDPEEVAAARQRQPEGVVIVQVGTVGDTMRSPQSTPEDYPLTRSAARRQLEAMARHSPRLWVFKNCATLTDPEDTVLRTLDRHTVKVDERWFGGASYPQLYLLLPRLPASAVNREYRLEAGWPVGGVLRGYDLATEEPSPGEKLRLRLYWQPSPPVPEGYHVSVQMGDREGRLVAQQDGLPLKGYWPRDATDDLTLLPDEYELALPGNLAPGVYSLRATLYRAATLERVRLADGTDSLPIGRLVVAPEPPPPAALAGPGFRLGPAIEVVPGPLATEGISPGGTLAVTLYWRARGRPDRDYTVFVQLLAADGGLRAQQDREPVGGSFPTGAWREGLALADSYALVVPPETPPGRYTVVAGLYHWQTGERLRTEAGADSITVGSVMVR